MKETGRKEPLPQIPNLSQTVMDTLDYFTENPVPRLDINKYEYPFVIGSGNAYNTGIIMFSDRAPIFADESNFKERIKSYRKMIDKGLTTQAVVISASGGKDSVWEIELAKQNGLHTTLLTTKAESDAAKVADNPIVYESIDEPYTYNTSTYMGMILSATGENPEAIKHYMETIKLPEDFGDHSSYSFVLPDEFMAICPMLEIKKSELFGPKLSLRAFSQGHARHAKFVIRDEGELVMSVGFQNDKFGEPQSRWDIQIPEGSSFATIMALTYWLVGRIQDAKPPYFKENIESYVSDRGPKAYGPNTKPFELIVPGNSKQK